MFLGYIYTPIFEFCDLAKDFEMYLNTKLQKQISKGVILPWIVEKAL